MNSRLDAARKKNWEIGLRIRKKAIEKFLGLKNPAGLLKYALEAGICAVIAVGIYFWVDPAANLIPAPLSYFFLVVFVAMLLYVHFAFK